MKASCWFIYKVFPKKCSVIWDHRIVFPIRGWAKNQWKHHPKEELCGMSKCFAMRLRHTLACLSPNFGFPGNPKTVGLRLIWALPGPRQWTSRNQHHQVWALWLISSSFKNAPRKGTTAAVLLHLESIHISPTSHPCGPATQVSTRLGRNSQRLGGSSKQATAAGEARVEVEKGKKASVCIAFSS